MSNSFVNIEKESGNRIIIDSGVVFTYSKDSDIDFILKFDDNSELKLKFSFEDDNTEKQGVASELIDENTLHVTCKNFNNPLGTGLKEALPLATHAGKNIYLTFLVFGGQAQRRLEYCFFGDK